MKLLITGAAGQLGQALRREAGIRGWETAAMDVEELDITDPQAILRQVRRHRPEVVVNAAAATRVDDLETDQDLALKVNSLGPRNLAVACRRMNLKLIHISTDYVFDGAKREAYVEWDATGPLSVYGRSKLLGEELVRQQLPDHFIVRTAWLYGLPGPNFVTAILGRARQLAQAASLNKGGDLLPDQELRVVHDQEGHAHQRPGAGPAVIGPGADRGLRYLPRHLPG